MKPKRGVHSEVYPFEYYDYDNEKKKRACTRLLQKCTMEWGPQLIREEAKTRKRMEEVGVRGMWLVETISVSLGLRYRGRKVDR